MLKSDIEAIAAHLPDDVVDALANKKLLAPGGGGFLGRYFGAVFDELNRTRLRDRKLFTTAIDITPINSNSGWNIAYNSSVYKAEYTDADYILFLAGIASPAHYQAKPLETIEIVTKGLSGALHVATMKKARLMFFSSSEIYGDPIQVPTPETYRGNVDCRGPRACYDESRRLGETLMDVHTKMFGTDTVIVRPFNVYGPGMQPTDYRVMPNFAASIAKGQPLTVYGDGHQTRTYCYVTDAINGFLRALTIGKTGEVYNIGNPADEISANCLAEKFSTLSQRGADVNVVPYPHGYPAGEPSRRCPDINKAREDLGYNPRIGIDEGVKKFLGWALEDYPLR